MLKRIKLIQGIGTFTQSRASGIELSDVIIIFGENRYGKSTLCDIFRSLSEDSPSCIINRQRIPNNPNKPPKVELQFETANGNVVSIFEDGTWKEKAPECSKLYVFDQSFIHRNVITGQRLERPNSENMTNFILGESNTSLFKDLADLNKQLRDERIHLSNLERQFLPHSISNIRTYVESPLPVKSKEQLEADVKAYEISKHELTSTIQNIDSIKQRSILRAVGTQVKHGENCNSINTILASSMQNIHQESIAKLENHTANHVNNPAIFKGWASQGVILIKDNCPFCGQVLSDDAKDLISAYQNAFNAEFDDFNQQTRNKLNSLRQPFVIPDSRENLIQQHQTNKQFFSLYNEPQVTANPELINLAALLEPKYEFILTTFDTILNLSQSATTFWLPKLEQKLLTPYDPAGTINFEDLKTAEIKYNQAIYEYWKIVEEINEILNNFKKSLDESQLNVQIKTLQENELEAISALKRINLAPLCIQYKEKLTTVNSLATSYRTQKDLLEQSQTTYLNQYFSVINQLFAELGSSDFEIVKVPNNRGRQIVYDLRIKFKGENISADKIDTVFSESDRRALALCIFLAKIMSLPEDEKSKAILILDDPVTSFDNERIRLILNKLDEIQRTIKQLIITTHYKGMAAKVVKKFRRTAKSFKLAQVADTCEIQLVENDLMMASKHDLAFDKIKSFVDREKNDDIFTSLRPFFEEEIRHRFKKQLLELGKSKADLSECIVALGENGDIATEVVARLSAIRDTLNTPMHELGDDALESTRSLAATILHTIYHDLK